MAGCTLLGIERTIPSTGVFPQLTEADAKRAALHYVEPSAVRGDFRNYSSYEECTADANQEMERERRAGSVALAQSEAALENGLANSA